MVNQESSLLARRGHGSGPALRLPVLQKEREHYDDCDVMNWVSTASTRAPSEAPCPASEQASPLTVKSGRRNLQRRLTPPCISLELVRKEQLSRPVPDCQDLSERYEGLVKLGEGSCGVVYKARARCTNQEVALKVMRLDDEERLLCARKEYDLLCQVKHPNIIEGLDFFTFSKGCVLVLEYFDGHSLETAVRRRQDRHLEEVIARRLFGQLLAAVAYLHKQGFIHRDIKPDNILVSPDMTELRLVDFNCAKDLQEGGALTMTGTALYMAPEVSQGESPSMASDIWAVGLCLYFMLHGRLPAVQRRASFSFRLVNSVDDPPEQSGTSIVFEGPLWTKLSEPCKDIMQDSLSYEMEERPTASDLLASRWLQD